MSAAATRRFVASVTAERTCPCGTTFSVNTSNPRILCTPCVDGAAERARVRREAATADLEARRAERARKTCDDCGTTLWTPGYALCGICDPEWDPEAVLAQIDREHVLAKAAA